VLIICIIHKSFIYNGLRQFFIDNHLQLFFIFIIFLDVWHGLNGDGTNLWNIDKAETVAECIDKFGETWTLSQINKSWTIAQQSKIRNPVSVTKQIKIDAFAKFTAGEITADELQAIVC
jgi:hypothetical protein